MQKFTSLVLACVTVAILTGCATSGGSRGNRDAFTEFRDNRPKMAVVESADGAIDAIAVATERTYIKGNEKLDEYISLLETKADMRSALNMANDAKGQEKTIYDTLTPMQHVQLDQLIDATAEWQWEEIGKIAADAALQLQKASDLKNSFKGYDAKTLANANAVSSLIGNLNWTVKSLGWLERQKQIIERFKEYKGR